MPYAIQERGFEYNDEYFELHKAVSFHKMIEDAAQARKEWVALERQYLDDIALLQREPFAVPSMNGQYSPIYQQLLDKLTEYGIGLDEETKKAVQQTYDYVSNEQLRLHRLNDEQLLDLLLATECNLYCLTDFESVDERSRYVLQFGNAELNQIALTEENYLPTTYYGDAEQICNTQTPDELFEKEFFNLIEPEVPLVTVYRDEDDKSILLKSLLAQYDLYFELKENESQLELHYLGGNIQALRAVNEVLVNPYFKIHEVTYTDLENLHQRQKEAFFQSKNERIQNLNARRHKPSFCQGIKQLLGK